jgi:sec-independent protein translocase protein TatC
MINKRDEDFRGDAEQDAAEPGDQPPAPRP